jgi:hypothetical protein
MFRHLQCHFQGYIFYVYFVTYRSWSCYHHYFWGSRTQDYINEDLSYLTLLIIPLRRYRNDNIQYRVDFALWRLWCLCSTYKRLHFLTLPSFLMSCNLKCGTKIQIMSPCRVITVHSYTDIINISCCYWPFPRFRHTSLSQHSWHWVHLL